MTLRDALGVAIECAKREQQRGSEFSVGGMPRKAAFVLQRFLDVGLPEIERLSIEVTSAAMGSEQISRTIATAIGVE